MVEHHTRRCGTQAPVTRGLALLLIICLVECASEQRISRGSKTASILEKANGWRSQRGGSCLSYGHSCWGAHGKRSGKPPANPPDWYLTRMLRRMVANGEMENDKPAQDNSDISAIYRVDGSDDGAENGLSDHDGASAERTDIKRNPEGIPMLDDEALSKTKFWQMMRSMSEEK